MNVDESSKFPASSATNVEAAAVGGVLRRMDDMPVTGKVRTGDSSTLNVGNNVSPNISPSVVEALASIAAVNDGGDVVGQDSKKGPKEATVRAGGTEDESLAPNGLISSSVVQVPSTCESSDDADRKHHDLKKDAPEPNSPCSKSEMVDDKAIDPTSVSAEASVDATESSSAAGKTHDVDHDVQEMAPTAPRVFAASNVESGGDNNRLSQGTESKGSSLDDSAADVGVGDSIGRNDEPQSHSRPMEDHSKPIQPRKRRKRPQRAGARPRGRREVHREDRQPPTSLVLRDGDPTAPQVHEADAYLDEDQIGARLFAELNDYKTQASREREHDDFYYRYYWEAPSSESESDYEETGTEERAGDEESSDGKGSGTAPSATDDGGIGAAVSSEKTSIDDDGEAAERSDQPRRRSTRKASTVATSRIAGGGGGQLRGSSSSSAEKAVRKNGRTGNSEKKNNRRFTRRMARDLDQEIANLGLNALVAAMLEIEEEEGDGADEDDTPRPAGGAKPGRLKRGRGGHGNAKGTSRSSSATASASTSSKKNCANGKNAGERVHRRGNKTSKAKNNPEGPRHIQRTTLLGRKRKHRVLENEAKVDMDGKDEKKRRRQVSISPPWPPPSPEPRKRRKIANPPKDDPEAAGLFCGSSIAMAKEAKDRILAATFRSATTPDTQESEQEERGAGTTTSSDVGCGGGTAVVRDGGPISPPSPMESPSAATAIATRARSSPSKSVNQRRFLVALLEREADSNGTGEASLDPLTPRDGNRAPARVHAAVAASNADSRHLAMADNHLSNDQTKTPSAKSAKSATTARVTRIIVNGKSLLLPLEHDGRRCRRSKNRKTTPDAVNSKSMVIPKTTLSQRTSPESVADGVGAKSALFSEAALKSTSPVLSLPHLPSTPAWIAEPRGKGTSYGTHHPMWHSKLIHCMRSGGRRWARHEFFYSDIDRAWFRRNEYVIDLAKLGIPPNAKLSRTEWRAVRQLLPHRPKRFSPRFISSQLKKLHCYRDQVRDVQKAAIKGSKEHLPYDRLLQGGSSKIAQRVPMPIRVGTTVTAYSRQAQMIQRGIVMGRDYHRNTYIVQFDCKELGYEVCPDFEVARQFQVSTSDRAKGAVAVGCVGSHPISGRSHVNKDPVGNEKRIGATMTSIVDASTPVPPSISSGTHSVNSSTQLCTPRGSTEPQMRPPIKIG